MTVGDIGVSALVVGDIGVCALVVGGDTFSCVSAAASLMAAMFAKRPSTGPADTRIF